MIDQRYQKVLELPRVLERSGEEPPATTRAAGVAGMAQRRIR
jgi:hypothetical protein